MDKTALDELAQVFCSTFHRQKWDHDCEEPSEINKQAWRNCVERVIDEYNRLTWSVPEGTQDC